MVDNFGVPKLDSHNWTTGSVRMQSSLVISDLWDVTQSEPVYSSDDTTQFNDEDKLKFRSHELHSSRSKSLYCGSHTSSALDTVIFCKYCKRQGHTVDNCHKLQKKRAREKAASSLTTTANDHLNDTQPPDTNSPCARIAFSMVIQASNMLKTTTNIEGDPCQPWIIDSGASHHMTGDPGLLEQGTTDLHVSDIVTADGTVLSSRLKGTVHITAPGGTNIRLLNVLFIPGLAHNLISVKAAMEAGADF
eukprot:scaffold1042_cov345-Pavlova_lutheri.AAC.4